jgi:hypothetical protein
MDASIRLNPGRGYVFPRKLGRETNAPNLIGIIHWLPPTVRYRAAKPSQPVLSLFHSELAD